MTSPTSNADNPNTAHPPIATGVPVSYSQCLHLSNSGVGFAVRNPAIQSDNVIIGSFCLSPLGSPCLALMMRANSALVGLRTLRTGTETPSGHVASA